MRRAVAPGTASDTRSSVGSRADLRHPAGRVASRPAEVMRQARSPRRALGRTVSERAALAPRQPFRTDALTSLWPFALGSPRMPRLLSGVCAVFVVAVL